MEALFKTLDNLVSSFMDSFFTLFNNFWSNLFDNAGNGGYICAFLILVFLGILVLIGLFKMIRKFGLFIFIILITIGIPCLWYFLVLPKL